MSTAIVTTQATGVYLDNVGRAALNFLRALFAAAPATAAASHGSTSQASLMRDRAGLLRFAQQFDEYQPNQAAELRNLAGRD
jgi:hypothetical protein